MNIPALWRTRPGVPQRTRLDLFETDALVNVLAPGGVTPSQMDTLEARRVIVALHERGESIECGCQERRPGPQLVPSVDGAEVAMVPKGARHANDCALHVLNPRLAKPAPTLMQLVKAQRKLPAPTANPFGMNNLCALIHVPMPGG